MRLSSTPLDTPRRARLPFTCVSLCSEMWVVSCAVVMVVQLLVQVLLVQGADGENHSQADHLRNNITN
jgi:hypothetical protein